MMPKSFSIQTFFFSRFVNVSVAVLMVVMLTVPKKAASRWLIALDECLSKYFLAEDPPNHFFANDSNKLDLRETTMKIFVLSLRHFFQSELRYSSMIVHQFYNFIMPNHDWQLNAEEVKRSRSLTEAFKVFFCCLMALVNSRGLSSLILSIFIAKSFEIR